VTAVEVATPRPDGSITHIVEPGQAPLSIAEAYEISLADLFTLNGLDQDSIIYPGDRLVIRPAFTPTTTAPATDTPTEPPPTRRPTRTLVRETPTSVQIALARSPEPQATGGAPSGTQQNTAIEIDPDRSPVIVAVVLGAFAILAVPLLIALKRRA
jgi:LysM repeat protein